MEMLELGKEGESFVSIYFIVCIVRYVVIMVWLNGLMVI